MVSRKVFAGNLRAERRTRKVGSGIEFADHRTYSRGDDFRYIDWNLYGRLDKLLLRLFEEEEDLYIYILIDVSDSMSIGSPLPKLHYAMQVGAALTYVGLANLDRVSIIPFGDKLIDRLPLCRAARTGSFAGVRFSAAQCPIGGKTEFAECMKDFVTQNKRRGLAVVISDFYDPAGFEQGINTLRYYKFEPFVLQVYDKREASPKLHGDLALVDCETGDDQRGHDLASRSSRRTTREHEKYCKELEGRTARNARCRSSARTPRDPVRRARVEDLPLGRIPAVSLLGPIGMQSVGVHRDRRSCARGQRLHHQDAAAPLRGAVRAAVAARPRAEGCERAVEAAQAADVAAADPRHPRDLAVRGARSDARRDLDRRARSVVVLIDASASMKAMDGDDKPARSRASTSRKKKRRRSIRRAGGDLAMIMKVDGQATPMSAVLERRVRCSTRSSIDKVNASRATPADLTRALGAAADALRDRPNPLIVIISDGAFPESQLGLVGAIGGKLPSAVFFEANLAAVDLTNVDVRYLPVGRRSDNVGIIAFNVRRYIANKAAYEVYIEIQNFGQEPAHRKLTLYNGQTAVDVRRDSTSQPGRAHVRQIYREAARRRGQPIARVACALSKVPVAPIRSRSTTPAYALLPARKKQKVLMVTTDNLFLEGALLVYDNIDPLKVSPAEYAAKPSVGDDMDVIIFDDYTPDVIPPPPASLLYFHPTGIGSPFAIRPGGDAQAPHITEIDEAHPVMRWITMSDVYMDKSEVFAPDPKKANRRSRSRSSIRSSLRSEMGAARSWHSGSRCPRMAARARPTCRCASRSRCCSSTRSIGSPEIRQTS